MDTICIYIYMVLPTGMHTPCMHQLLVISLIHQIYIYIDNTSCLITNISIHQLLLPWLSLCVYLFIYLSIHLSMSISIYLSIYQSINQSIYLSIYLSIYQSIYLSINQSIYLYSIYILYILYKHIFLLWLVHQTY